MLSLALCSDVQAILSIRVDPDIKPWLGLGLSACVTPSSRSGLGSIDVREEESEKSNVVADPGVRARFAECKGLQGQKGT